MITILAPTLLATAGVVREFAKNNASLFISKRMSNNYSYSEFFSASSLILLDDSWYSLGCVLRRPGTSYRLTFLLHTWTLLRLITEPQANLSFAEEKLKPGREKRMAQVGITRTRSLIPSPGPPCAARPHFPWLVQNSHATRLIHKSWRLRIYNYAWLNS